jgi:hypothetical protein
VSLLLGVLLGNRGRRSVYRELRETVEGGLQKWSISFCGSNVREPGGMKEGSGDGHLFPWEPHWETWERAHMPAVYEWKKVLGRVSHLFI